MNVAMKPRGAYYVLPDEFAGLQIMVVDGRPHLIPITSPRYLEPPLCGASVESRNVTRRLEVNMPAVDICDVCVAEALS